VKIPRDNESCIKKGKERERERESAIIFSESSGAISRRNRIAVNSRYGEILILPLGASMFLLCYAIILISPLSRVLLHYSTLTISFVEGQCDLQTTHALLATLRAAASS